MDTPPDTLGPLAAAAAKFGPGLLGALASLRWLPPEMKRLGRAVSTVGGFSAAMYVGPMIAEITSVSSVKGEAGIIFLTGLFGMIFAGELISAIKEAQLGPLLRDWLRRFFRLGGS